MAGGTEALRRVVAVIAAVLVAVSVAACGDDDTGDGDGGAIGSTAAGDEARTTDSSGDAGGSGDDGTGGDVTPTGPVLSGNRRRAGEAAVAVDEVYDALRRMRPPGEKGLIASGGAELCELMTEEARRQTVRYARVASGIEREWNCEQAVGLLIGRTQRQGRHRQTLKATVIRVDANGDSATASIRFGRDGPVSKVRLVQEDGRWRLAASPVG